MTSGTTKSSRILIVDDERDIRESLQEFFEDEGFEVATAQDGREALDQLRDNELPAVMILDLIMPVRSGNEVYADMKSDPRYSDITVVIATSDPSRAPPGVVVLKKPLDLGRLLGLVKSLAASPVS